MSQVVTISSADGQAVVVKRATGSEAASLRAEGERLRRAAHPGVVTLLDSGPADGGWELRMAHGGRPAHLAPPGDPVAVGRLVAATAAVVADLHDLGVVHGRIDSSHVLVGAHGRVRLCGLGAGDGATPADDVAGLGAMLVELLGDTEDLEPIPDHRWRRRRAWRGWGRRALLTLADQASAEPPSHRPSARRLAASIREVLPSPAPAPLAPGPEVGAGPAHRARQPARGRERRRPRLAGPARAAVGATIGLIVLAAGALRPGSGQHEVPRDAPVCVRLEAAGCATPIEVTGNVVAVGTQRFRVGRPGDVVVIGDWDCDGAGTPALLRPSSGAVFVFDGWAGEGQLTTRPVAQVAGASSIEAVPAGGSCHRLRARLDDGRTTDLSGRIEGAS